MNTINKKPVQNSIVNNSQSEILSTLLRKDITDFKLIPYAKSASQEFNAPTTNSLQKLDEWHDKAWSNWDNTPWYDKPWTDWDNTPWYDKWGYSLQTRNDPLFKECIQVRLDSDEFGFVRNNINGMIFYTVKQNIELIKSLEEKKLSVVSREHPKILEALSLNT